MRADTLAAARELDRPDVAYIVPFEGPEGVDDHRITWADLDRDAAWAEHRLKDLGLGTGDTVLLTFSGFEGPWLRPLIDASRRIGMTYGIAEAMGWDHGRTRVFQRQLDLKAVIGLSAATVEGLATTAALDDVFRDVPVVLARPDAARVLRAAGVAAGVFALLGPALALECAQRQGAHVDATQWQLSEESDGLAIRGVGERTAGRGRIVVPGKARIVTEPCACGSGDPRVLL
ncbi:hypothetical protein LO772_31280 [Yinghuangia sp. ASG 101]|uniref:hypothetical protein n=1 Tax=Yinghuangia sp. ASG 101 TaxID=2896848 RepID=UPI001E2CE556|nr:hypothetical protein [Yinghuangia sp. ASG 101]UGQ11235.1 hypothetical protein LO772_31280 [Yinghuangia sp. ASG 101]